MLSVLLPVFNNSHTVIQSVESMLAQEYADFELLIIDDGSTDDSVSKIKSIKDGRIRLMQNTQNYGLSKTLNRGIAESKYNLIARMDADDLSLPHRLQVQMQYMEANPQTGICGSWFAGMNTGIKHSPPCHPQKIKTELFRYNVLGHPTVIFRKEFFAKYHLSYNENLRFAQDYDLWVSAATHFELANIDEVLLLYSDEKLSAEKQKLQDAAANEIRLRQVRNLGIIPAKEEEILHISIINIDKSVNTSEAQKWLARLEDANRKCSYYIPQYFEETTARILRMIS